MVQGVQSEPGLNGMKAVVTGHKANGRVKLKIFQRGPVALKPANLRFLRLGSATKPPLSEEQRAALLDRARTEAKAEYERLVEEARAATDELTRKRMAALENSVTNLGDGIRRRVQQEVFDISRKVLTELASQSLEESMITSLLALRC